MGWPSVINQARVKRILISSLERQRLAHAYLFSGPEGVGKFALAFELAKALNCERSTAESCGVCRSCVLTGSMQHPNVRLICALPVGRNETSGDPPLAKLPDDVISIIQEQLQAKVRNPYCALEIPNANAIKINSIRELRRESSLTASGSGRKVFLILEASLMKDEAANAILKTLEEPLEDTVLILTTSLPHELLPTIVSRCQHLRFESLAENEIRNALVEREGASEDQAIVIARLADGSYTRALQYLSSGMFDRRREAIDYLRSILYRSPKEVLENIERIASQYERHEVASLFSLMQDWLRAALMLQEGTSCAIAADEKEALHKFVARYSEADYPSGIKALERAISLLNKNVYIPLILSNLAFHLRGSISPSSSEKRKRIAG